MTTLTLLTYICAALFFQLAAGVGVIVWRRFALEAKTAPADGPVMRESGASVPPVGAGWPGWREFRVTRRSVEDAAGSQCSFYLQPVDGAPLADFMPGQYLTFSLPAGGVAGAERNLIRCYSLSDRPGAGSYRITVKRMPPPPDRPALPPGAGSGYFHDRVQEGDVVKVKAPAGRFCIDADATVPAVFIAGGIGITPMMSMLRWCVLEQPGRTMHLYYGVGNSADHAFRQVLSDLATTHPAFKLHVLYANPGPDDVQGRDYQQSGYIDLELLRSSLGHGRHRFYVCGPPPMMKSVLSALHEWGVNEGDIHFEAFGPASEPPAAPATNAPPAAGSAAFEVRLNRSGRTVVWDGHDANLLDFVERHGVAVESGCRSGSCGACETRLVSGTVHYADKPDHEIAPGHCLLCVGKPQSALELAA